MSEGMCLHKKDSNTCPEECACMRRTGTQELENNACCGNADGLTNDGQVDHMRRQIRKIAYWGIGATLLASIPFAGTLSAEADVVMPESAEWRQRIDGEGEHSAVEWRQRIDGEGEHSVVEWRQRIDKDVEDGEYLTMFLGMDRVTRQSVIETLQANWDQGLMYHKSAYATTHNDPATCVNYGGHQYIGRERQDYGYNCTGFAASVLYYANGDTEEDALAKMKEYYRPLAGSGSFTDGTGWYYYLAEEHEAAPAKTKGPAEREDDVSAREKGPAEREDDVSAKGNRREKEPDRVRVKVNYLGETEDEAAMQVALTEAENAGKVKAGDVLFFWPSTGWDCHFGIYAGRDAEGIHRMYHAAGMYHRGVKMNASIDLTAVTSEGPSYMYVIPLPDAEEEHPRGEPGWQTTDTGRVYYYRSGKMAIGWVTEDGQWYYLDPKTGAMTTGWRDIGGQKYFFCSDGRMARSCLYGLQIVDADGVCREVS